jgi:hypothetical protein
MDRTDSRQAHSPEPESQDSASPLNLPPAEERAYWRGVADGMARAGSPAPAEIARRAAAPPDEAAPWDGDPPEETGRPRHDAFTGAKKQIYLKALAKHGCILDACRVTGVSPSTVYNHQASDPDFARYCRMAVGMASTPLELTAYERAVVGHEEEVIRGGKVVGTRTRRSDYMLRVLLQGADPRKYGSRPGFSRKRLLKSERKRIEQEVRAEMAEPVTTFEDAIKELDQALDHFGHRQDSKRREEGWTELGRGLWIPPGWVWTGQGDPSEAVPGFEKKPDAVCNSSNSSTLGDSAPGFPGEGDHAEHGGVAFPEEPPQPAFSRSTSPADAGEEYGPNLSPGPPVP